MSQTSRWALVNMIAKNYKILISQDNVNLFYYGSRKSIFTWAITA